MIRIAAFFDHTAYSDYVSSSTKEIVMTTEVTLINQTTLMFPVICQKWEESERGWGSRPDGYSLHRSNADRLAFIAEYLGTHAGRGTR